MTIRSSGGYSRGTSQGLTLIETLVVVGIIGVIAGLLLPAVQVAREAARRAQCQSRLRELGLAWSNYESARGKFPASEEQKAEPSEPSNPLSPAYLTNFSPHALLLPFLDNSTLYNAINLDMYYNLQGQTTFPFNIAEANTTAALSVVAAFLCPSDPSPETMLFGCNSFRANAGLCENCDRNGTGAFNYSFRGATRAASFIDGLSNTLVFSEKPIGSWRGGYSSFRDWAELPVLSPHTMSNYVSTCASLESPISPGLTAGGTWMTYGAFNTWFFSSVGPNSPVPDCGVNVDLGTGVFAARSYHPGGVNAVMGDGSVHWFSSTISLELWRALSTRAGREIATVP